ncbi:MAG: class I SAM-dependent methyltransferase [Planctomycetaceae bacterium]
MGSSIDLDDLRIPSPERLIIDLLRKVKVEATTILATSKGRGQLAVALSAKYPEAKISLSFMDLYAAEETREYMESEGAAVEVLCDPDFPEGPFDLAAIPLSRGGESELAREQLQEAFDRLRMGGLLLTGVDNRKDTWLHHELEKFGKGITRLPNRYGVVYRLKKEQPLKRRRDLTCEFAFRDGEHLVYASSRPGVFSHRKLDLGARALIEAMVVTQGMRVLDIGCGAGAVGLAAAMRAEGVTVHGVDSHARAVASILVGAARNGVANRVTAELHANGGVETPGSFDLAVGNPPYYSHYKIAEIFLQSAKRGLKPGGKVLMVTKQSEWFEARMGQLFEQIDTTEQRGYRVVCGVQPG